MNVDWQSAFNVAMAAVCALGGYWLKALREALRDLQNADFELTRKVQSIEVLVAGQYMKRDEVKELFRELAGKLDRIESKLDDKADKP